MGFRGLCGLGAWFFWAFAVLGVHVMGLDGAGDVLGWV